MITTIPRPAVLRIERVVDEAAFRALEREWSELLADSAANTPFLTWEWLHSWWTHLNGPRRLCLVTARDGDRLVALVALATRLRWAAAVVPARALEHLGCDRLSSDYLDVIARRGWEAPAIEALAAHLTEHPALLELPNVDATRGLARELAQALAARGWSIAEQKVDVCPFIRLAGHTWESYLATLETKDRSDFNRMLRNLHKRFDVRFEIAESDEQRRAFLQDLVNLHNQRRQDRGGSDAFHTADLLAFHELLTARALASGWLRLFRLSLDGRPVAALYGFLHHGTFYFLQTGFDPEYARHGVGLITIGLTIQRAIQDGAEEYDFLRGAEPYKFRWAREVRTLATLTASPRRARERLFRHAEAFARSAKDTARRTLPQRVLSRLAVYRQQFSGAGRA